MPSRKKAQGKARKAAKAEKAEEEGKKQSAVGANTEQQQAVSAQIQRLQLYKICFQNTSTTVTPTIIIACMGILHCQRTLSLMIAKVRLVFMQNLHAFFLPNNRNFSIAMHDDIHTLVSFSGRRYHAVA
eukprot:scaffold4541_cov121-Skeletonema_marinoi.AAC.3